MDLLSDHTNFLEIKAGANSEIYYFYLVERDK
jgi:hypothetical protein